MTSSQLAALGLSPSTHSLWCRDGRLHRIHHGVYAVGHPHLSPSAVRRAAMLAGGPTAALGRLSAGRQLDLTSKLPKDGIEIAIPGASGRRRPGIRYLRLASLIPEDVFESDGVRCTTVARTLVDLAGTLSETEIERAVERAEFKDRLDRAAIAAVLSRVDRARGVVALRAALGAERLDAAQAGSGLERRTLRLLLDAGLPRPVLQQRFVIGSPARQIRVDFWWPERSLVVEVDGPHHRRPLARRRDAERDAALLAQSVRVHRIGSEALDADPAGEMRALAALLAPAG